jgi:hypothetical protein
MNNILDLIKNGKVPDIPFTVKVENESIIKLAAAAVITAAIIILIGKLVKG